MSSDLMSGVFYCQNLRVDKQTTISAFCKPINIQIFSAPPPVKMRLVTYDLHYVEGDVQPSTVEEWESGKLWRSPFDNHKSFSFTTGTIVLTMDMIFQNIRRHFYEVPLRGKECLDRHTAFMRLMNQNTSMPGNPINELFKVKLRDIHHILKIDLDGDWIHTVGKSMVRYRGDVVKNSGVAPKPINYQNKYIALPHEYKDPKTISRIAINDFSDDVKRDKVIKHIV